MGVDMIDIHHVHVWKCHNAIPFLCINRIKWGKANWPWGITDTNLYKKLVKSMLAYFIFKNKYTLSWVWWLTCKHNTWEAEARRGQPLLLLPPNQTKPDNQIKTYLESSCSRVFISQMGFVAVIAVKPKQIYLNKCQYKGTTLFTLRIFTFYIHYSTVMTMSTNV